MAGVADVGDYDDIDDESGDGEFYVDVVDAGPIGPASREERPAPPLPTKKPQGRQVDPREVVRKWRELGDLEGTRLHFGIGHKRLYAILEGAGVYTRNTRKPRLQLSTQDKQDIYDARHVHGMSYRKMAKTFGMARGSVYRIANRERCEDAGDVGEWPDTTR